MRASGNSLLEPDTFLLGTFASNCSGGMTVTKVPERWDNCFANNLRLAQLLDDAGIDFMLPIARWIGYGGDTNFHGNVLETITWAVGLLGGNARHQRVCDNPHRGEQSRRGGQATRHHRPDGSRPHRVEHRRRLE